MDPTRKLDSTRLLSIFQPLTVESVLLFNSQHEAASITPLVNEPYSMAVANAARCPFGHFDFRIVFEGGIPAVHTIVV